MKNYSNSNEVSLTLNTITGNVYINKMCLHQDNEGYYTISTTKLGSRKIQYKNKITEPSVIERIEKFCS